MKLPVTLFATLFLLLALAPNLYSQQYKKPNRIFKKGDSDLSLGIGLLPTFVKDRTNQQLPPISLRYEHRLARNFSLGIEGAHSVATTQMKSLFSDTRQYRNRFYHLALRSAVHCNCKGLDNWDIYGGFALGFNFSRISVIGHSFGETEKLMGIKPKKNQMSFYGFLGGRYAITPHLSLFGEIGYGASILQIGIGYKL